MMGGSNRGSYFKPKKITTSEFVYPKKSLLFLAYPKKSLNPFLEPKKIPLFFTQPKKIPASCIDPKKSLLAKISDQKYYSDPPLPPVIKICEWCPWGIITCKLPLSKKKNGKVKKLSSYQKLFLYA